MSARKPLTTKQRNVLNAIRHIRSEGGAATVQATAERSYLPAKSAEKIIDRLARDGLVIRPGVFGARRGYGTPDCPPPDLAEGYTRILSAIRDIREAGGRATQSAIASATGYPLNDLRPRLHWLRQRGLVIGAGPDAGAKSPGYRLPGERT